MKHKYICAISVLSFFFISGCCSSDWVTYKCPDGEPVNVLKDISKAYPVFASEYDAKLKAGVKAIDSLLSDANLEISVRNSIIKLRQDLDQENSRIQMELQTAVIGLHTTPCDKTIRDKFQTLISKISVNTEILAGLAKSDNKLGTFKQLMNSYNSIK